VNNTCEFRICAWDKSKSAEVREVDGRKYLTGRPVCYNSRSVKIYDQFFEYILPGTFDESLSGDTDIVCSVDHDMRRILGRQSANTLKLTPDDEGIRVECSLGEMTYSQDAAKSIARKDMPGMSFIMEVLTEEWKREDGVQVRYISKAKLFEVSFVFFPAYPATSAKLRSIPWAIPVEGEQRAIARMNAAFASDDIERKKRQLWLWEHS
jgi:HK97 family phage prohead protease